jgi:Lon-like protease
VSIRTDDPYHHGSESPAERPPHTAIGWRSAAALVLVVVAVLVAAALNWVKVDSVVYIPGPVYDTLGTIDDTPVVSVGEGLETYPTDGELYFTTVRLDGGPGNAVSAWEWLRAAVDPARSIYPREQVFPEDVTAEQVREQNTELMQHSQQDAAVVGLRAAGIEVPEDVVVAQVIADAPADGVLQVDDQILAVEDDPVTDTETVRARLQEVEPGQDAQMTVLREGEEVDIDVPTKRDEKSGRTIVGVYLAPRYEMPYPVTLDAGRVGGPSAGLMFSLAIYDTITPEPLTGGATVAGTGTITGRGNVGPISGILQKMHASEGAGAELFLAPAANCDEVAGNEPGGLTVVPVTTFDEARGYVEQVAEAGEADGLDLPTCEQVVQEADDATETGG